MCCGTHARIPAHTHECNRKFKRRITWRYSWFSEVPSPFLTLIPGGFVHFLTVVNRTLNPGSPGLCRRVQSPLGIVQERSVWITCWVYVYIFRNLHTDFHSGCTVCTPPAVSKQFPFPTSSPAVVISYFLELSHSGGVRWNLKVF